MDTPLSPQRNPYGEWEPLSNDRLVTHVEKIEKAAEIFAAAAGRTGGYLKGVVTF
jgi:threonine dehydrogenase-like Zn-dependent dehydrogenase